MYIVVIRDELKAAMALANAQLPEDRHLDYQGVEKMLEALGVSLIDVYQINNPPGDSSAN